MKKLLLIVISVIAFAGMSVGQDIYTSGYYNNSVGTSNASVYRNGMMLYSTGDDVTLEHESVDVISLDNDVYWVDNIYDMSFNPAHANVFKNGVCWLNTAGSQSNICTLFTDGTDVYAAGTVATGGVLTPVVWKNNSPTPFVVFDGGHEGSINDAVISNGVIYACGTKDEGYGLEGVVWICDSDGSSEYNFGDVTPKALAVYNNTVYVVSSDAIVFKDYSELYTLTSNGGADAICIDAGDVYVLGYEYVVTDDSYHSRVWKNGSILYEGPVAYEFALEANSYGVFYLMFDMEGKRIWKDGAPYHTYGENHYMYGLFIEQRCQIDDYRTLPYRDGFENGMTDWTCWSQWDSDQQNDGYASYWQRSGEASDVLPASGHHCAYHRYNTVYDQSGILSTPLISIPEGGDVTMTFLTYEEWPGDYYYEGVWVIEGGHKVLGDEVWKQTEPSAEWKTVSIDLNDYKGKKVAIDFRYSGLNAHSWYIDDVYITQAIGVEENDTSTDSYAVYPNPACDRVRIEGLEAGSEVQLINAIGELVKTVKVDADSEIGIAELASGLYLVRCGNTNLRFVKE